MSIPQHNNKNIVTRLPEFDELIRKDIFAGKLP